jgi:hypothetical protein
LEYWAEKYKILSPTLYDFLKGRGTNDCEALLSSFEYKQQTLVEFLDISGAYDNVLIDKLCDKMHQVQLPLKIVRVMWNLLWRKKIVFNYEKLPVAKCVRCRSVLQSSVSCPFLSIVLWWIKFYRFVVRCCNMLMTLRFTRLTLT